MANEYGAGTGNVDYPAYRFHLTEPMRLVHSVEEDEVAMEEGYRNHPYPPKELAEAARQQALPSGAPPHASGSGDTPPPAATGRK